MIYLEQTTEPQTVAIPRNLIEIPGSGYVLTLENTIDRSRVTTTPLRVTPKALSYAVTVALPEILPAGEYRYELRQGAAVLAVGLLTLGEYQYETTQYEAAGNYTQYEG